MGLGRPFSGRDLEYKLLSLELELGKALFRTEFFTTPQFVHNIFVHNFGPLPNQQTDAFPLELVLQDLKTELRTLKIAGKNSPKIANKQNYEQTGVSDFYQVLWN